MVQTVPKTHYSGSTPNANEANFVPIGWNGRGSGAKYRPCYRVMYVANQDHYRSAFERSSVRDPY